MLEFDTDGTDDNCGAIVDHSKRNVGKEWDSVSTYVSNTLSFKGILYLLFMLVALVLVVYDQKCGPTFGLNAQDLLVQRSAGRGDHTTPSTHHTAAMLRRVSLVPVLGNYYLYRYELACFVG